MATGWGKFETVQVKYDKGQVIIDKPDVVLKFNNPRGKDCVRWVIWNLPDDMDRLEVKWEVGSPFLNLGVVPVDRLEKKYQGAAACLLGTGNIREEGVFKYDVMFLGKGNQAIGLDPRVRNDPNYP